MIPEGDDHRRIVAKTSMGHFFIRPNKELSGG